MNESVAPVRPTPEKKKGGRPSLPPDLQAQRKLERRAYNREWMRRKRAEQQPSATVELERLIRSQAYDMKYGNRAPHRVWVGGTVGWAKLYYAAENDYFEQFLEKGDKIA